KAHDVADVRIVIDDQDLLHAAESSVHPAPVDGSDGICTKSPQTLHRPCTPPPHRRHRPFLEVSMTDIAAPQPEANPPPEPRRQIASFLASDNLLARASVLGLLTLL